MDSWDASNLDEAIADFESDTFKRLNLTASEYLEDWIEQQLSLDAASEGSHPLMLTYMLLMKNEDKIFEFMRTLEPGQIELINKRIKHLEAVQNLLKNFADMLDPGYKTRSQEKAEQEERKMKRRRDYGLDN